MSELSVGALSGLAANSYVIDVASGSTLDVTNATGTLPSAQLPSGSVLRVLSTYTTDYFTTTSITAVDVPNFTLDITPSSASNKILVMFSFGMVFNGTAGQDCEFFINRDATEIALDYVFESSNANDQSAMAGHYLDSPNTTSSVTYKMTMEVNGGSGNVRRGSFTVMEIAG